MHHLVSRCPTSDCLLHKQHHNQTASLHGQPTSWKTRPPLPATWSSSIHLLHVLNRSKSVQTILQNTQHCLPGSEGVKQYNKSVLGWNPLRTHRKEPPWPNKMNSYIFMYRNKEFPRKQEKNLPVNHDINPSLAKDNFGSKHPSLCWKSIYNGLPLH